MDFTLAKYEELLNVIKHEIIPVFTVKQWILNKPSKGIILRHDVDRFPSNALEMAKLENKYDIKSTYYIRIAKFVFKPAIIKQIALLGHEIGYHYEDLSLAKGDYSRAIKLFENHLSMLRRYSSIETIAMHGRPLSKYNNLMLWSRYDIKDYKLYGDAYLSIDYSETHYFTDTGRDWGGEKSNLRDKTNSKLYEGNITCTDDLKLVLKDNKTKIALVVHPERWNSDLGKWVFYYFFDMIVNIIKKVLKNARSY